MYNFWKSIPLREKQELRSRSRQKLPFGVSTANECVFLILLLACVRLHILHRGGSSRASLERLFLPELVQILQQNVWFCQSRSEKPLVLKSRILKILRGVSSFFDDRKRQIASMFDFKLTSPRKGPFWTLAKCFVLYHFGDLGGPFWILRPFDTFFDFFFLFLL